MHCNCIYSICLFSFSYHKVSILSSSCLFYTIQHSLNGLIQKHSKVMWRKLVWQRAWSLKWCVNIVSIFKSSVHVNSSQRLWPIKLYIYTLIIIKFHSRQAKNTPMESCDKNQALKEKCPFCAALTTKIIHSWWFIRKTIFHFAILQSHTQSVCEWIVFQIGT